MKQIQWYPGHMAKTKRILRETIKQIDVVLELVDARVPFSSMNPIVPDIIDNTLRVIVMNKADLVSKSDLDKWKKYFNKQGMGCIYLDARHHKSKQMLLSLIEDTVSELKDKALDRGIVDRPIRVMIVGIPNVGKSTLINLLSGKKKLVVGDKPGVTKQTQFIRVSKQLEIMDTPGILWPKFEDADIAHKLALIGAIKDSILPLDNVVIYGLDLLKNNYRESLENHYKIEVSEDPVETLDNIGVARGCLMKGRQIDYDRVYRLFLHDFRHEGFGKICLDEVQEDV